MRTVPNLFRAARDGIDQGPLPNFLIIGAQKCGTTTLAYQLRAHPQAFIAPGKELNFFNRRLEFGLEWYRSNFSGVTTETAIGEATPGYMYEHGAIPRMAAVVPDAKLIAILRDPVDRAYSHYWHNVVRGRESLSFPDAVLAEEDRLLEGLSATFSYLDRGRYLRQLLHVSDYYPRDRLLVLVLEELRDSPASTWRGLCAFLGIAEGPVIEGGHLVVNRAVTFHSLRLRRLAKRLPFLPRKVLERINTRTLRYPPLDPELRADLRVHFREENRALGVWLGRDLSVWER